MKKTCIALAAVAALAFSGAAFAENGKKPVPMTDSQMDGVTAAGQPTTKGAGQITAGEASGDKVMGKPPEFKGLGQGTARGPASR